MERLGKSFYKASMFSTESEEARLLTRFRDGWAGLGYDKPN